MQFIFLLSQATDDDEPNQPNSEVMYTLQKTNLPKKWKDYFKVDSSSGEITLTNPLDYEQVKDIILTINASDKGLTPKSNTTTVTIIVIDRNDEYPKFTQQTYAASLRENETIGKKFYL